MALRWIEGFETMGSVGGQHYRAIGAEVRIPAGPFCFRCRLDCRAFLWRCRLQRPG
jgi:hypothetical protein